MKNLLVIHQSSELYGSDKTLLSFLENYNKNLFHPIVVLPEEGPLKIQLEKLKIEVHIMPVLKLHRKMFTFKSLLKFIFSYKSSMNRLLKIHNKNSIDLVYSNTISVLLGFLFSKKYNLKHIWHVHEIIKNDSLVKRIFLLFLNSKFNKMIIYNSISTQKCWNISGIKNEIIWNGVSPPEKNYAKQAIEIKKKYFQANDEICIGLIGRINRWKGQNLLLSAFENLIKNHKKIRLIFIGSSPKNQDYFDQNLRRNISEKGLDGLVRVIPFQSEIYGFQHALDIIVVPSIEPEPFGLVAIEGMFAKKPVVAANHGGLQEIVLNNETGFTFLPGSEAELSNYLEKLIISKDLRIKFGENGYKRACNFFSVEKYVKNLEEAIINC